MNFLPVGSVIQLKEAKKRLMIIGILSRNGDGKNYDYLSCPYPEGYIDSDNLFMFNHEDIDKIHYLGYEDIERQIFIKKLSEELKKGNEEK